MLWLAYFVFIVIGAINTVNNLKTVKETNVTMRAAGAFGLVRHYYIESDSGSSRSSSNNQVADRIYSGLSLSRLLVPKNAINSSKIASFYALQHDGKNIHFASASGNVPATHMRLYIDVLAYLINRYLLLHVGFVLLWAFSSKIYSYIRQGENVKAEIAAIDSQPGFRSIQLVLLYTALIMIFI